MGNMAKINGEEYGLEESKARQIKALFEPMLAKMAGFEERFNDIAKLEVNDETCKQAKSLRLEMVKVRTGTALMHKEQKQYYLQAGRCIDGWKNAQVMASEGLEDKLKNIENHFENIEKEKRKKLHSDRVMELNKYNIEHIPGTLGAMDDDVWKNYIQGVKLNFEAQIEAERKAEQERKEAEAKKIAEEKAMREENERLKKEQIENEKKAKIERERVEAEQKKAQQEREKAEYERKAIEEKARIEKEKHEAELIEIQRKENERVEAEQKRIADEEAREANQNHRRKINKESLAVLSQIVNEDIAKEIIKAIAKNEIPHIRIQY